MTHTRRGAVLGLAVAGICVVAAVTVPSPAATATTSHPAPDTALTAARVLVRSIPADQRYACHIDDPASEQDLGANIYAERAQLRASLTCGADGHWNSLQGYATFASAAAAERVFDAYTPGNDPFCEGPTTWSSGGHDVGRVACYQTSAGGSSDGAFQYAVMVWTYTPLHLFGWAYDNDDDTARLQEWWHDRAGPLSAPESVPELPTSAQAGAAAKKLAGRLPEATRSTCSEASLDERPFDAQDYGWRLWIAAALSCRPRSAARSLTYVAVAPDALGPFFDDRYAGVDDTGTGGVSCPNRYTYEMDDRPADASGLGTLACFFRGTDAVVGWSVLHDHVLAEATGTDVSSLLRFAAAAGPQRKGTFQRARFLKPA